MKRMAALMFEDDSKESKCICKKVFAKGLKRDVSRQAARKRIKKQTFVKSGKTRLKFTL